MSPRAVRRLDHRRHLHGRRRIEFCYLRRTECTGLTEKSGPAARQYSVGSARLPSPVVVWAYKTARSTVHRKDLGTDSKQLAISRVCAATARSCPESGPSCTAIPFPKLRGARRKALTSLPPRFWTS